MYIMTKQGWKPLWTMSEPEVPEIPWLTPQGAHTAKEMALIRKNRTDFVQQQQKVLNQIRERVG